MTAEQLTPTVEPILEAIAYGIEHAEDYPATAEPAAIARVVAIKAEYLDHHTHLFAVIAGRRARIRQRERLVAAHHRNTASLYAQAGGAS